MSHYGKEFDQTWRLLRAAIPTRRPVRVCVVQSELLKRHHGDDMLGDCDLATGTMRIAAFLDRDLAIDTLIHEYAHHLSRRVGHGKAWGEAYSRCYRAVFPENQ